MKKFIGNFLIALLCIGLISGCSKKDKWSQESVIKIDASGKLAEQFNSIKELKENAYDMVEVDVKSNESQMYNELGFTVSTVEVMSSLKGKFQQGQQIKITETGGKYTYTGKDPKIPKGQLIEATFAGIPVMSVSEKYFLFITPYKGEATTNTNTYRILGVVQGKFKEVGDGVEQCAPDELKVKDYSKESKDKFKKIVDQS